MSLYDHPQPPNYVMNLDIEIRAQDDGYFQVVGRGPDGRLLLYWTKDEDEANRLAAFAGKH